MEWNDQELMGKGFFNWKQFNHPQLGVLEIGGWNPKFNMANPPPQLLPGECHKVSMWALRQAAALPELSLGGVSVEQQGMDTWKLTACFENSGYLPTCTSNRALEARAIKPDTMSVEGDISLLGGQLLQEIGYLEGYGQGQATKPARSTARTSWLLRGTAGTEIRLTYRSQRGGVVRAIVRLGETQ